MIKTPNETNKVVVKLIKVSGGAWFVTENGVQVMGSLTTIESDALKMFDIVCEKNKRHSDYTFETVKEAIF